MLEAGAAFMKLGRAAATKHLGEKDGSITIELIGYLFPLLFAATVSLRMLCPVVGRSLQSMANQSCPWEVRADHSV